MAGKPAPCGVDPSLEPDGDALALFLMDVRRYELLDRGAEVELAKRIERGDLAAKDHLVNANGGNSPRWSRAWIARWATEMRLPSAR
jgi:Sigma-70 factor, region 1.2